ncbi:MAG: hypothetical protein ACI4TF_08805 [Oliverpabstia sp.]
MKTLYIGSSQKDYNEICSILEKNKIKYKSIKTSRDQNTLLPGWGTSRSFGANFSNVAPIYEIMVNKKDYDNALGFMINR